MNNNSYTVHREESKGYVIELVTGMDAESPREWDNLGTMVCWHRRYDLGDEQPKDDPDEFWRERAVRADKTLARWGELLEAAQYRYSGLGPVYARIERHYQEHLRRALVEQYRILPLYLLDHSGIAIRTRPFNDPWDSGRVGFIFLCLTDAVKELIPSDALLEDPVSWETRLPTGETLGERADRCLEAEVRYYDDYLCGRVVDRVIYDPDGEQIDCVGGYYPDEDGEYESTLSEARSFIDRDIEDRRRIEAGTMACYI